MLIEMSRKVYTSKRLPVEIPAIKVIGILFEDHLNRKLFTIELETINSGDYNSYLNMNKRIFLLNNFGGFCKEEEFLTEIVKYQAMISFSPTKL